mmetsp:Transcript_12988/g.16964  ORF Transcript_12988/g.16964 Transcript_12988/m.16964 type:complete len:136 (-) Transcript_12988:704-1111(-)
MKCIFTHQDDLFSLLKILRLCEWHSSRSCWSFSHGTSWWNGRRPSLPGNFIGIAGSVAGFLTSDQYDGALQNISALEDERRKKLINEVTQVLIAAGATANSLQMTSGFGSALREYAQQDSVRDGIWRACINSLES